MIALWPAELPRPLRSGYQYSTGDGRLRTGQDRGPVRMRRRFSSVVNTLDLTFVLSANHWARLQRFYREELTDGVMPFIMPDYSRDGWPLSDGLGAIITTEDGNPIVIAATQLCQFGEALPSASVTGVEWQVSFRVEILP